MVVCALNQTKPQHAGDLVRLDRAPTHKKMDTPLAVFAPSGPVEPEVTVAMTPEVGRTGSYTSSAGPGAGCAGSTLVGHRLFTELATAVAGVELLEKHRAAVASLVSRLDAATLMEWLQSPTTTFSEWRHNNTGKLPVADSAESESLFAVDACVYANGTASGTGTGQMRVHVIFRPLGARSPNVCEPHSFISAIFKGQVECKGLDLQDQVSRDSDSEVLASTMDSTTATLALPGKLGVQTKFTLSPRRDAMFLPSGATGTGTASLSGSRSGTILTMKAIYDSLELRVTVSRDGEEAQRTFYWVKPDSEVSDSQAQAGKFPAGRPLCKGKPPAAHWQA
jgi:hypothetical protein